MTTGNLNNIAKIPLFIIEGVSGKTESLTSVEEMEADITHVPVSIPSLAK